MKKNSFFLFIFLSLSSLVPNAKAIKPIPVKSQAETAAQELSQALQALGSFQAQYEVKSPKTSIDINIFFNQDRPYCLLKITPKETNKEDIYMVSSLAKARNQEPEFEILYVQGKSGGRLEGNPTTFIDKLGSPMGVFSFLAQELKFIQGINPEMTRLYPQSVSLDLKPNKESFNVAAGFSNKPGRLNVSWLDPKEVAQALEVVDSPEFVEFVYPDKQKIKVDKKTGLMLEASYPDPVDQSPRTIRLKSHTVLQENSPYTALIPNFSEINIQKMSDPVLDQKVYVSLLQELGLELSKIKNFDEILAQNSKPILENVRKLGQQIAKEQVKSVLQESKLSEQLGPILQGYYQQYLKDHPNESKTLSYADFLERLKVEAQTDPARLVPPEWRQFTQQLQEESLTLIKDLSKEAQRPLKKFYELCMPAITEGYMVEFALQMLEGAKKTKH